DGSSSDEWRDYGMSGEDYEGPSVFDDDQYEEELMPVYDTSIEDVIEKEEGFVGKEGFGWEEDNIKVVVVVANDLCSSMIQTSINVDFSITVNSNPHELIWLQKGNLVEINTLIGKKYHGYVKAKPMDDKFGFKMIKVQGRVIIKKGNLMQEIQSWMLRVQGMSKQNSRTRFFQDGENDAEALTFSQSQNSKEKLKSITILFLVLDYYAYYYVP
nr:hypothetical protein [Tanacetum cinerariifolium]